MSQKSTTMTAAAGTHLCSVCRPNECAHRLLQVRRHFLLRHHQPHALGDQLAVELENIVCLYGEILANDLRDTVTGFQSDDGPGIDPRQRRTYMQTASLNAWPRLKR